MKGTVEFEHVSKRYRLGTSSTLRGVVSALLSGEGRGSNGKRTLWALRDVTFRVEPGETIGVIGPNGSGKTTTLKLLSNITRPTVGRLAVHGRVASLIELGAGFHPELTGLENIYLNGTILGLKRREIARKLDDIVAFSGLERFLDTPVKRYSSGMYVRLGFAVAAHVQADVLLVDEVLAVGDSEFRKKCTERMEELRDSGTTLILVSHNMYQVRRLCGQTLLLDKGALRFIGDTGEAVEAYEKTIHSAPPDGNRLEAMEMGEIPGTVIISDMMLLDQDGRSVTRLKHDQPLRIRVVYSTRRPVVDPIIRVRLIRSDNTVCAMTASAYHPGLAWTLSGKGTITMQLEPVQLVGGSYLVDFRVLDSTDTMPLASSQSEWFDVTDHAFGHETLRGVFVPNIRWSHEPGVNERGESAK